jgi:tRNA-binding EMAP/Myf-like protein
LARRQHPVTLVIREIREIFRELGFTVALGPEANRVVQLRRAELPAGPPGHGRARHVVPRPGSLLRTHTSPVQVRTMQRWAPPIRILAPVTSIAATSSIPSHAPMFSQIEGLSVDEGVSFVDLKATLTNFARRFFGTATHALPSELLPVHGAIGRDGRAVRRVSWRGMPDVQGHGLDRDPRQRHGASGCARVAGIDSERYTGWAFGMGPGRIAIVALWHSGHSSALRFRRAFPGAARAMNVSYNWLKISSTIDLSPVALADLITSRAATVDAVESLRDDLRQFVVARVVECARHPDSDHLSVTKVDAGTGDLLDVVCGAPNVQAGKLYPFAKTGTKMPAGFTIERRRSAARSRTGCYARRARSAWARSRTASSSSTSTFHRDAVARRDSSRSPTRASSSTWAPTDPIYSRTSACDARSPPALGKPLEMAARRGPDRECLVRRFPSARPAHGRHGRRQRHHRRRRLAARGISRGCLAASRRSEPGLAGAATRWCGRRSINNVVDITNFMLLGFGQPMHAFDAKRLRGPRDRRAPGKPGETLVTLDGIETHADGGHVRHR